MADPEVYENPELYFDQVIEINLTELTGTHMSTGLSHPTVPHRFAEIGKTARENGWPLDISVGLIGSCTNSSYEDISRAASIAKQAVEKGLIVKSEFTLHQAQNRCDIPLNATDLSIFSSKWEERFLPTPAARVLDSGRAKEPANRKKTPLCIRLTGIFRNVPMEIQIPMHL
jgi:hypothetical protein